MFVSPLIISATATSKYQTLPRHHLSGKLVSDVDVGGGAIIGRSFNVVNTRVTVAKRIMPCTMSLQNLSPERGRWAPRFSIPSPLRYDPRTHIRLLDKPLVFSDAAVHWLCSTNGPRAYHILTIHVVDARIKMTSTELP
ncbi:hypothetical protein HU200_019935 [Digitaria exilis]|uniref:Uncharacterized protein n=1 Tax=Digitaria exilis TaxID=1010633 RepID=A0A835F126_9POAL|nr:hypothetical protein HU200_019935 [Digitaria exilis]